jgi:hypothetical protein
VLPDLGGRWPTLGVVANRIDTGVSI